MHYILIIGALLIYAIGASNSWFFMNGHKWFDVCWNEYNGAIKIGDGPKEYIERQKCSSVYKDALSNTLGLCSRLIPLSNEWQFGYYLILTKGGPSFLDRFRSADAMVEDAIFSWFKGFPSSNIVAQCINNNTPSSQKRADNKSVLSEAEELELLELEKQKAATFQ